MVNLQNTSVQNGKFYMSATHSPHPLGGWAVPSATEKKVPAPEFFCASGVPCCFMINQSINQSINVSIYLSIYLSIYQYVRIFLERKAPQDKNWYYTDQMYVTKEWQHDRMLCMHSTQMCCTPPCCKCQCSSMNSTAICAAKVQKFEWPGHCRWGVVSRATTCQVP